MKAILLQSSSSDAAECADEGMLHSGKDTGQEREEAKLFCKRAVYIYWPRLNMTEV
jgi:hypothetical protein